MPNTATAPVADWFTLDRLHADPYPIYARLRREAPIAWVPATRSYFLTSYRACRDVNLDQEVFTATREYTRRYSMGASMLHKDDPEHATERKAFGGVLKPNAIARDWNRVFEVNARKHLAGLRDAGPGADLVEAFSGPFAADCLREMLGFRNVGQHDVHRWSQAIMDGNSNSDDDDEVWERYRHSGEEIDEALDEVIPLLRAEPDGSLISTLINGPEPMDLESIRANVKMTIGGGVKEPRDALVIALWGLLSHPDQFDRVRRDPGAAVPAFDEAVRWVSPIGMYPRKTTRATELAGVSLPAGAHLSVVIAAANRDETVFGDGEEFDINRERKPHLAFANGAHICAGQHVAKAMIGRVALPMLISALPGLRPAEDTEPRSGGWIFRRIYELRLAWDV
ncbi:cytochrome P450 [Sphaerisporangium siamense]|uniref:Cytochrome P450 n=1 Tax=Sphaerisporangium siamense TaxID=795645 RepID=A0A7W7G831_9ACTN|nr:cytochrome P450 [Sphaerisporangium siamense]MBB4699817.1 cytochrome P450 [Sphaerisporangium siamense]GII84863.1 cytochrome P450 [Sphaerisporangium siamense]